MKTAGKIDVVFEISLKFWSKSVLAGYPFKEWIYGHSSKKHKTVGKIFKLAKIGLLSHIYLIYLFNSKTIASYSH